MNFICCTSLNHFHDEIKLFPTFKAGINSLFNVSVHGFTDIFSGLCFFSLACLDNGIDFPFATTVKAITNIIHFSMHNVQDKKMIDLWKRTR